MMMKNRFRRSHRVGSGQKPRALRVEPLEARRMLHGEGVAWASAPDLTLSFAPDGTDIAGAPSALYSTFDSVADRTVWQDTVQSAFDTWAQNTDARITRVADGGEPFGASGPRQGDPRFGDIRIGAIPLADDIVALSIPNNDITSGTWTGDVLFNANTPISAVDELFAVALHEAGHVYGLGHSTDPLSPMYQHGIQPVAAPTAQDIANLQSLYGVPADWNGGDGGGGADDGGDDGDGHDEADEHSDDEIGQANAVSVEPRFANAIRYDMTGQIADRTDVDNYRLVGAEEADGPEVLTITVRSVGPDFFLPEASVFKADGEPVDAKILVNASGEFILQVDGANPERDYVVRVAAADFQRSFAVGGYTVTATYGTQLSAYAKLDSGSLDAENIVRTGNIQVPETRLTNFLLTSDATEAAGSAAAWAVIYNPDGDVVFRAAVHPGETRSAPSVLLSPGNYRLEVHAGADSTADVPEMRYTLEVHSSSIPIGPGLVDPTTAPVVLCTHPQADPATCLPADIVVTDPVVPPTPLLPGPPQPSAPIAPPFVDLAWWYWDALATAPGLALATPSLHNWQNAVNVNQDSGVSPIDALLVINTLNAGYSGQSVRNVPAQAGMVDVNNDQVVTPRDALLVLNSLNAGSNAAGEGEGARANASTVQVVSTAGRTPSNADLAGIYWFVTDGLAKSSGGAKSK